MKKITQRMLNVAMWALACPGAALAMDFANLQQPASLAIDGVAAAESVTVGSDGGSGVTADKTPVVNVLGYAKQSGGAIDIDLANAGLQAYGIYIANKNPKGTETVYGEFAGGALNATVGGTKSAAVYGNKGSADVTFKSGETVTLTVYGSSFLNERAALLS